MAEGTASSDVSTLGAPPTTSVDTKPETSPSVGVPSTGLGSGGLSRVVMSYISQNEELRRQMAETNKQAEDTPVPNTTKNAQGVVIPQIKELPAAPKGQTTNFPEMFGSAAMALAGLGSMLTRRPLVNALNAGAAVMKAYHQNDMEAAQKAFDEWKINTDNAIRLHQYEMETYNAIMAKHKNDAEAKRAEMTAVAASLNDHVALALLNQNNVAGAIEVLTGLNINAGRIGPAASEMSIFHEMQTARAALAKATATGDGAGAEAAQARIDTAQQAAKDLAFAKNPEAFLRAENSKPVNVTVETTDGKTQTIAAIRGADGVYKTVEGYPLPGRIVRLGEEKPQAVKPLNVTVETPDGAKRTIAAVRNPQTGQYTDLDGQALPGKVVRIGDEKTTKPINVTVLAPDGTRKQAVAVLDPNGHYVNVDGTDLLGAIVHVGDEKALSSGAAQEKDAEIAAADKFRQKFGRLPAAADEPAMAQLRAEARLEMKGAVDDEAADYIAGRVLAGDEHATVGLARSTINMIKVNQSIQRLAKERGILPSELAIRVAEFTGALAAERTLGTRAANMEAPANVVAQMAPLALQASAALDRTQYPSVNSVLIVAKRGTGDTNVINLASAVNSLRYEYSRFLSPTGVPTDKDKEKADSILDVNMSPDQFATAVKMVQREIEAGRKGIAATRQEFREGMLSSTAKPGGGDTTSGRHIVGDFVVQNGKRYRVTAVDVNGRPTAADEVR